MTVSKCATAAYAEAAPKRFLQRSVVIAVELFCRHPSLAVLGLPNVDSTVDDDPNADIPQLTTTATLAMFPAPNALSW